MNGELQQDSGLDRYKTTSRSPAVTQAPRQVRPCDFRARERIAAEKYQPLNDIHAVFAQNLSFSLSSSLRHSLEVIPLSTEQMNYAGFLEKCHEFAYLASLTLHPSGVAAVIQFEPTIVLALLDLLLGGHGTQEPEPRSITDIEEKILENTVQVICKELQGAWGPFIEMKLHFDGRLQPSQSHLLMPATEMIIAFEFEMRLENARGLLKLGFPVSVPNTLLRQIAEKLVARPRSIASRHDNNLRQRLQDCEFRIHLVLPRLRLSLRDLLALEVGRVLVFRHRRVDPAALLVSGKAMFAADPVASGVMRAAQIRNRLGQT